MCLDINLRETLQGEAWKKEDLVAYEQWLNERVGDEGTLEQREGRYKERFKGVISVQGYYAWKMGVTNAEELFSEEDFAVTSPYDSWPFNNC